MPVELIAHKTLDACRTLTFCYHCGEKLPTNRAEWDRDHVPPKGLFADADREPVLILRTHVTCHSTWSEPDEELAQLIGLLQHRPVPAARRKLRVEVVSADDGVERLLLRDSDIRGMIRRCIRGFHAALYREFLPERQDSFISIPPLQAAGGAATGYTARPTHPLAPVIVADIGRARSEGTIDVIDLRNGKCRYECVWVRSGDGIWCCLYSLNLYNWVNLGDPRLPLQACVGLYRTTAEVPPPHASRLVLSL